MNNREVLLLSCFLLCAGAFELSGKDILIQGSIGDSGGDSENSPKNPKIIVDNKPVGDEGNLLEHDKKSKEDDQEAAEGEGFDPKDVAFDFGEDPSRVTIDERKGEENEPEEDPVLHGDKESNDGASEDPFEDSIVEVDVQLVEDKGELLEQEQNVKQDEQEVGKSVISDEEFGPKDVGFDPAEDPKKATTDEVRDEPAEPEEDPSHFGDKGDTEEPWKRFFKHPVALNNNQPVEDEGNLPEKDEGSEKDDQLNENSVVHGEEFSPEDAGFDTDKISAGTIVDDGITDEGGEPEDDPKNFASNPCSRGKYKLLNTYDRLVGNKDQSSVKCDQRDVALPGWFRFTDAAGDRMPTKCPETKRCGTHAPGWLNGKHPSVADGIVSREVCYHWSKNCCRWKNKINVKNCGAFYLYELQKPPACSLRYCGEATECSVGGYQELNQADRAMGNSDQSRVQCDGRAPDNILVPKWYRMTGDSGDQIPEKCVPMRRCGTHAPGWLNGKHPSLQEGVVARQVCYHWTRGCCQWKQNIKIRNCGDFYVYELQKPPACSLRYCGNKGELITLPPPTTAPNPVFNPCSRGKYKLLNTYDRLVGNKDQSSVKCDQRDIALPGWFRFTSAAGDRMPTKCPETKRCGTHAPGWLNGKHPSVADGIVSRDVCYHWSKNCCRWKNKINVKNCGAFYLYELQKPPACSLRYCGEATECSVGGYQELNQADRAMGNSDQSRVQCDGRAPDNILVPKWYRMTGDSGDQIPEKCVPMRRCGTHAPGWLNGKHPSLQEGVVALQVCYHWTRGCCQWKQNIKIRNCGDFYVYELQKPPACSLRYCGNKGELITLPPPTTAPNPVFNPCSRGKYKLLNTYDRLVGNKDQSSVKCDQRDVALPGWFRFTGAAGDRMPTKCPETKRCGTHAPGWLNGKHPSVADGIVSRDVCYHWSKNCCRWKNKINVKNCGAFYLYELQKPPTCSLRYCGEATECSVGGYQELNQADRAMGNSDQSRVQCDGRAPDNILVPKWYRMTGDSGDQIPEKCVPMRRCGTHAPGWLNGKHPSLRDGVVARQVCYHWTGGCCQWKNSVKIRNCGDFYVYELQKPPACSLRYCGNKEELITLSPPTTAPNSVFNPCSRGKYKLLNTYDRLMGNKDQSSVKCDQRDIALPGWFRFTGAAGDRMPTKCPETKRCGTHAPGWLNGKHPSVADGIVSRDVCYHWSKNCCRWKNKINVKNCGAFYLYELQKPPACSLRYCGEATECSVGGYQELNQADRAMGNSDQSRVQCDGRAPDNILVPKWYRMTGDSGDQIPEKCVPMRRCGTHAPGWLNGKHPSLREGVVARQVCYHWTGGCCQWKNSVKIRNCGDFYVYELQKPPACSLRYCGNKGELITLPPPTTAPNPVFNPCSRGKYKLLNTYDRLVGNKDQSSVKCDQRDVALPGWFRFTGAAGDRMPTKCPETKRCGTHAPGWLNGKHPSVADGIVSREVCYHWSKNCCRWKNKINVKNCGAFYLYELQKPPACSLRYCGEAMECSVGGYQELNQADRAMGNSDQSRVQCDGRAPDNILVPKWYRMTGDSGDQIPEKCVPMRRCGTHAPGWLNGKHPRLQEGVVARQVCYHWTGGCCQWKNSVKIRNCGDFYVYELRKPPACSLRYCGNKEAPTTQPPIIEPTQSPGVNVTCVKDEMFISIPKKFLPGIRVDHLRLSDMNCGATETQTHFILRTELKECHTTSRDTKNSFCYRNKVLKISDEHQPIITRVREVEIPFSCCYSNTGIVSSVALKVESKKIVLSKDGFGEFALEMKTFPDNRYIDNYKSEDFPVTVPSGKILYVEVNVDTEDLKLEILAETCFGTPDPNPIKPGLKYLFISDGCAVDDTLKFLPSNDERSQRFSLAAFKFLGDHQFAYLHCKVKICNATDPKSRCAKGCLREARRKRSLNTRETNDEEYILAQGPFVRAEDDDDETESDKPIEITEVQSSGPYSTLVAAVVVVSVVFCVTCGSILAWKKKKRSAVRSYQLYTAPSGN